VVKDEVEAAKWYRLAAEQGDVIACLEMGWLHLTGIGMPADFYSACYWFGRYDTLVKNA
jgi:TPR repeat protein